MVEKSSVTRVNFFRGYGIYNAGAYAARLLHPLVGQVQVVNDIVSRNDQLLLTPNNIFNASALSLLEHQHLKSPFDTSICVVHPLSSQDILQDLLWVAEANVFLTALLERLSARELLARLHDSLPGRNLLLQKLKVMKVAEPGLYELSLCATLVSLFVAKSMRLSLDDIDRLMLAGLYHAIGLLHLEPEFIADRGTLSAADALHLHAHVRITHALMALEGVSDSALIELVAEHQERCDGTGYPGGKVESEISLLGQVLGLAVSAARIYLQRMQPQGRHWGDVIGAIVLARQAYLFRGVEVLKNLLAQSQLPLANVVSGADTFGFSGEVLNQCEMLRAWFDGLREPLLGVGYLHGDRQFHALQNSVLHIALAYKPLLDLDPGKVLLDEDGVVEGEGTIADLHLMAQELDYHVRRLSQMLEHYQLEHASGVSSIQAAVKRALHHVHKFSPT